MCKKITKRNAKRQPKFSIWSLMIGSVLMSCCDLCTSLILTTWDKPVKCIVIAGLSKVFPVFSPFSFNSCCLYSTYALSMVLLLALSTFSCVYCFLLSNKYTSPLSIKPFKHPHFFCSTIPSWSVSTVSAKNSSSSSLFSTSGIMFSTYRKHRRKRTNMTYKNNLNATNDTSVIIFTGPIYCNKSLWLYFQEDVRKVFLGLTSFLFFNQKCFISRLYFYATSKHLYKPVVTTKLLVKYFMDDWTHRTAHLSPLLNNAKNKQRSLVVTLGDLQNSFGEGNHDFLSPVLKFYHLPELYT